MQGDLIQRRLFTVHFHAYASPDYIKGRGQPKDISRAGRAPHPDLRRRHAVLSDGCALADVRGARSQAPAPAALTVNNITALKRAVERGIGIAVLPDYLIEPDSGLVQVLNVADMPSLDSYLVYPEEMKSVARVQVFRDFLVSKAQRWSY